MQKYAPLVKQNVMKIKVFIKELIRRDGREGEKGAGEDRDKKKTQKELNEQFEEEDKEQRHLPLLVVQLPQGTAFLLSSRLDSPVKRDVLVTSGQLGKGSCQKRLHARSEAAGVAKVANN